MSRLLPGGMARTMATMGRAARMGTRSWASRGVEGEGEGGMGQAIMKWSTYPVIPEGDMGYK